MSKYLSNEHRRKLSDAAKRRWADPALREAQRQKAKEWWAANKENMYAQRVTNAVLAEIQRIERSNTMSSYYRDKRDAGLFDADEETRLKAAAKLDKAMQARIKAAQQTDEGEAEKTEQK